MARDAIQGDKECGKKWIWGSHKEFSFKHFKIEMLMGHPEIMSNQMPGDPVAQISGHRMNRRAPGQPDPVVDAERLQEVLVSLW